MLSPHKIAVLIFIEKYARIGLKHVDGFSQDDILDQTHEERRATTRLLFKLVLGDMSFSALTELVESASVNPQHVAAWKKSIKQILYEGVDSLLNMFDVVARGTLRPDIEPWPCIWTSTVGLYLRQMALLYKRLSFTEAVALHTHLIHYCDPAASSSTTPSAAHADRTSPPPAMDITMTSPPASPSCLLSPDNTQEMANDNTRSSETSAQPQPLKKPPPGYDAAAARYWSVQEAEQLIGEQTQLLQFNETAALPPRELHQTMQHILTVHPHLSAAYYLCSLNFLRVGEVRGAVDSLAASYDCQQVSRATPRTLRYATLNMGAVHAQFGSRQIALRYVAEAVSQSQEAGDNTCLQHSLAWLYSLVPHTKRETLVKSAVQRSALLQLPYLSWLSIVNHAAHSTNRAPASSLQMLSSRVDGCVGVSGGGVGSGGGVWGVEAGVWTGWFGNSCVMTVVCSQLVLHAPPTLPRLPGTPFATSQTVAGFCNLALALTDMGEYDQAHLFLQYGRRLFPHSSPHSHYLRLAHAHISCTHNLFMGLFTEAKLALSTLASDYNVFVLVRSCEVAIAQGESANALQKVADLQSLEQVQKDPQLQVQVQLLHAAALCTASTYSVALKPLILAVAEAKKHHLAMLYATGTLMLMALRLQLGLLQPDSKTNSSYESLQNPSIHPYNYYNLSSGINHATLDTAISVINSNGSVYDQGRSLLLVAKLRVLSAKGKPHKLGRIAKDLEQVRDKFAKVDALNRLRETLYLSARLYHEAGNHEARNKCSYEFRKLEQTSLLSTNDNVPPTPIY